MPGEAQLSSGNLPSFCSPRSTPADTQPSPSDKSRKHAHDDVTDFSLLHPDHLDHNTSSSSETGGEAPPSSLLSPAFTPPSTPGTHTPSAATSASAAAGPRGVPVDSSLVSGGGCGSKRPRLLESLPEVQCIVRARIPTVDGAEMFLHLYTNSADDKEHLAIVFGNEIRSKSLDAPQEGETELDRMIRGAYTGRLYPGRQTSGMASGQTAEESHNINDHNGVEGDSGRDSSAPHMNPPLVRIHSECYTGETAWSARCDCGEQLDEAARLMGLSNQDITSNSTGGGGSSGSSSSCNGGIIIYLRQEGRGIGLGEKLKAYNLQDLGSDTVEANILLRHPADARSYGLATAMLMDLGQTEVRLLTNNPDKIRAVEGPNREIVVRERVAMVPLSWKGRGGFRSLEVEGYLKTKIEKMGHLLQMGGGKQ